jgi:hypothetical protein
MALSGVAGTVGRDTGYVLIVGDPGGFVAQVARRIHLVNPA